MTTIKQMVRREHGTPPLRGGHALCQGCGIPTVVRTVIDSIPTPVVVVTATGCLEVATSRYPTTAWNVPWLHVAFENAAATMSGIETAYRVLARRGRLPQDGEITFLVLAGDGGTYDIGLQALSGALERGHRLIYVCYDNEAYMNTGIQRSGATPRGASTTTSPSGRASLGKAQQRKDITAVAVAHHIPYVAQAVASYWHDLSIKVARAAMATGPSFLNVLTDCPLGWGHEARIGPRLLDLAVETRFWPLYEVDGGRYHLNYIPSTPLPVQRWLEGQARFRHLLGPEAQGEVAAVQAEVDSQWQELVRRCRSDGQELPERWPAHPRRVGIRPGATEWESL